MIVAEGISKSFGPTRAVISVSFSVGQGEVVGLLGPNGSGKTTIMRILTGFFPPSSGSARVGGLDVQKESLATREMIGYLPENVILYPDLSVERFLSFCAAARGVGRRERGSRIEEALAACGLEDVRRRLIGKLSKGYRQRVGVAQAVLHRPKVLILDEPTVGLDPEQVMEIRGLIKALAGTTTILLSTHILSEVSMTCTRVIIIDAGRVIAQDRAENLARRMEGVDRTRVRIRGPREAVVAALRELPGVERLEERREGGPGEVSAQVYSRAGEALRAALASVAVNSGWELLEMGPVAMSLEDLFVRLVREERAERLPSGRGNTG